MSKMGTIVSFTTLLNHLKFQTKNFSRSYILKNQIGHFGPKCFKIGPFLHILLFFLKEKDTRSK